MEPAGGRASTDALVQVLICVHHKAIRLIEVTTFAGDAEGFDLGWVRLGIT